MAKKVLLFSTYPIAGDALTGGPRRVKAIVDTYRSHGIDARHIAIFSKYHHPTDFLPSDIAISGAVAEATKHAHNTGDYIIGRAIGTDEVLGKRVLAAIESFHPDVIEVEQVFPYIGLQTLLRRLSYEPRLVHSSHNIEAPMKREIMEYVGEDPIEAESVVAAIDAAERAITRDADITVVVTKDDAKASEDMHARRVIIARNGISAREPSRESIDYWKLHFKAKGIDSIAVFVGAAHPPNMSGYKSMIGFGMGFLSPNQAIVLAGDVGTNLMSSLRHDDPAEATAHKRLMSVGRLDDDKLAGLLAAADVILLPITEGGGSNLKTAEAILSQKKVVGTTKAFRSFEEFIDLPNVVIADTADDFRRAIAMQLRSETPQLSHGDIKKTEDVLWSNCLREMAETVRSME